MAGICTSPYPSPYPIEKVGDSPYPYPYPVNAGIPRQNGDGFEQYPRGRIYLSSLVTVTSLSTNNNRILIILIEFKHVLKFNL